jgi:hypothetical protein
MLGRKHLFVSMISKLTRHCETTNEVYKNFKEDNIDDTNQ